MSILVIAAHPDDEVLGCGGTLSAVSGTHEVTIAILGEGASSRYDRRDGASSDEFERLRSDSRRAAAAMGVSAVEFGGLPDNRFDELPLLDIVKRVEDWIRRFRPATIYTHHPGDLNVDHGLTFRAVLTATRPVGQHRVPELLTFEVPSSTEWAFQHLAPPFRPNVFVDIAATLDRKITAMACYDTESRQKPHPRSTEGLRALAEYRGAAAGMVYAEAFELIRSFR